MNKVAYFAFFLLFSIQSMAGAIESFEKVEVNPHGSSTHKVTADIQLACDIPFESAEDTFEARELIAVALSSLTVEELRADGIEMVKYAILKKLKQSGRIGGSTVEKVYVTHLVTSFVGANYASVFVNPKPEPE